MLFENRLRYLFQRVRLIQRKSDNAFVHRIDASYFSRRNIMIADLNNNFVFLQIVDRMRHMLASKVNKSVVFLARSLSVLNSSG